MGYQPGPRRAESASVARTSLHPRSQLKATAFRSDPIRSVRSCWLNAHLLSRRHSASVQSVCLTGLIIWMTMALPDWRPFKSWILGWKRWGVSVCGPRLGPGFCMLIHCFTLCFFFIYFFRSPVLNKFAALVLLPRVFGTQSSCYSPRATAIFWLATTLRLLFKLFNGIFMHCKSRCQFSS